jgi:surface protein
MYFMFFATNYSSSNYDDLLQGWSQLTLQSNVIFDIPNTNYCNSDSARQLIIDSFGWTISDSGYLACKTAITDANFQDAINTCLSTNPEDGMCSDSEYGDMPSWDVSQVTNMDTAFNDKTTFNADISTWDVSNVTSMNGMFHTTSFNQNIGSWNMANATDINNMFFNTPFNQDISVWDVSNITECEYFSLDATAWTESKPNFTNCTE